MYGLLGDCHGVVEDLTKSIELLFFRGIRTVFHLGDFGCWGEIDLDIIEQWLGDFHQTMFIIPGNHEAWSFLSNLRVDDWTKLRSNIFVAPRAHTWQMEGVRFCSISGAGSIDKEQRSIGVDWWPDEEILDSHITSLITKLDERQWDNVDIFLCHEAPEGVELKSNKNRVSQNILDYCAIQRTRLKKAVDRASPTLIFHGHWHQFNIQTLNKAIVVGLNSLDALNSVITIRKINDEWSIQ
jgi:Icc-related predicted phosphoesterase